MQHFTNFVKKFHSDVLVNAVYAMEILNFIVRVYIAQFCLHITKVVEIFYILLLFLICLSLHWG
jgi:hypothetical protein